MGNSHTVDSLLRFVIHPCGRLAEANLLLLPTAVVLVMFLWLRMRPRYHLVAASLGASAEALSAEFNYWWLHGGAPQVFELDERD